MTEWQRGWKIVVGAAIGSGLGVPLFYYVFSLFTNDMITEFGVSRGEMANAQALIVVGALVAPLIGKILDQYGFRRVFTICTLLVAVGHVLLATSASSIGHFAVIAFLYGAAGIGCGPLAYTRPVNAWFWENRGLALGLAAIGTAITAAIAPPLLAILIEEQGWRSGFLALAFVSVVIGLPLTLMLVRDAPPAGPAGPLETADAAIKDTHHFRDVNFWLLCASVICMSIPGAGLISQLSPIVQEEGIGAQVAAFGITGYALGQVIGRITAGYFLDRANPRLVAFAFTFVPAIGFILLAAMDLPAWGAVVAVALVGVQQGAEIDLFAWYTARRFGIARYGTVYGWIIAAAWIGNALGILGFGWMHDATGTYQLAEAMAAGLLAVGAVLIAMVRLDRVRLDTVPRSET